MFRLVNTVKTIRTKKIVNCIRFNSTENSKVPVQSQNAQAPSNPQQEINQTPQQMTRMNPLYKYLVYKYSSQKYNSPQEVPDVMPSSQVNYAKDKGRAKMTIILIGMTIFGACVAIFFGKREQKKGAKYTDDIIRQHAEYSKAHQDMLKKK